VLDFPVDDMDEPEDVVDELSTEETEAAWQDIMGVDALATQYSEGDTVQTPQGIGVISGVFTSSFDDVEASSNSPAYAVALKDARVGSQFYKASQLEEAELPEGGPENPEEDIEAMANIADATEGYEALDFTPPESWRESDIGPRAVALKAWRGWGPDTGNASEALNFTPELHPRDEDGKFTETGGIVGEFADAISDIARGESEESGKEAARAIQRGADPSEVADVLTDEYGKSAQNAAELAAQELTETSVTGFDSNASTSLERDSDFYNEAKERLAEAVPEGQEDRAEEIALAWVGDVYSEDSAPIFQQAEEMTGNDTIPESARMNPLDTDVSELDQETTQALKEETTEIMREVYGDEVKLYRGLSPGRGANPAVEGTDAADKLRQAKDSGKDVVIEHRTVESWTTDPSWASRYTESEEIDEETYERVVEPGAMIETEIPVEQAVVASISGVLNGYENEVVIAHEGERRYSPDQIIKSEQATDQEFMTEKILTEAAQTAEVA
jgi:hypothetical protein